MARGDAEWPVAGVRRCLLALRASVQLVVAVLQALHVLCLQHGPSGLVKVFWP